MNKTFSFSQCFVDAEFDAWLSKLRRRSMEQSDVEIFEKRALSSYTLGATGAPITFENIIFQLMTISVVKSSKLFDSGASLAKKKNAINDKIPSDKPYTEALNYEGDYANALFMLLIDFLNSLTKPLFIPKEQQNLIKKMEEFNGENNVCCEIIKSFFSCLTL